MKNVLKILKHFMENRDKEFTMKQVSEELKINYRIAYQEIKTLEGKNLIKIKKIGNSNVCSFNYAFNELSMQAEAIRKEELLKDKNLKVIHKRIMETEYPFYILLVFGSYSSKTRTKNSDIDICLISDNETVKKSISSILEQIPLNIHFIDFTPKEFISMLGIRKPNVGHEILKNNVILKGAEEFYEMANYVKQ